MLTHGPFISDMYPHAFVAGVCALSFVRSVCAVTHLGFIMYNTNDRLVLGRWRYGLWVG